MIADTGEKIAPFCRFIGQGEGRWGREMGQKRLCTMRMTSVHRLYTVRSYQGVLTGAGQHIGAFQPI